MEIIMKEDGVSRWITPDTPPPEHLSGILTALDTKKCSKCGETKPVSEFYRRSDAKHRLKSWCKRCDNANATERSRTPQGKAVSKRSNAKHYASHKGRAVKLTYKASWRAKKKGIEFDIDAGDVERALVNPGRCALTGRAFVFTPPTDTAHHPLAPSLDRIDNTRGYVPGNVQLVTDAVNRAKNELTVPQFIDMCGDVLRHAGYTVIAPKETRVLN